MSHNPNEIVRRARVASLVFIGVFCVLGGAFFRTQVLLHERYARKSEENRLRPVPVPAPRGIIYDRHGQILAENVPGFTVSILAKRAPALRSALERFSQLVPLPTDEIDRLANPKTFRAARPTVVLGDATFEQVSILKEHQNELPGLVIQVAPKRFYPDSDRVAAFVGYTREITESHLAQKRYAGYKQGQQIGALGLEDQFEELLRGREGVRYHEVNARNQIVRDDAVPELKPVGGNPLYTNIDARLQRFIADSVFADGAKGAMVVMEPRTGAVLAIYSSPAFDPNDFIGGISRTKYRELNEDPDNPLFNRAIQGTYAPASTYKLVMAALGMQEGVVHMDSRMPVPCTGSYRVGNRSFHCWKLEGHGSLTLSQAIASSCNVYFFQLGLRLGFERIVKGSLELGFGARSGIDIPQEARPIMPSGVDYYNARFGTRGWSMPAVEVNMSIGQGEVTQSVLNMARFYAALATDGHAPKPMIAQGPAERSKILKLSPEQLEGLRTALASVVSSAGTAGSAQVKGLVIAGKTGTAQNPHGLNHGWFVGFAPAERPRTPDRDQLLVSVIIEHGLTGGAAAQRAKKVFEFHFKQPAMDIAEDGG